MKVHKITRGMAAAAMTAALALSPASVFAADYSSTSANNDEVSRETLGVERSVRPHPTWVSPGKMVQYPNEGGTWEYGFWNAKYRSYYTVNRCHGSTVVSGDRTSKSINTASGKRSIAELWAVNNPWANPQYYYRVC